MNRITDPLVGRLCMQIKAASHELHLLQMHGQQADLMMALYNIICDATRARMRLNDLGVDDPLKEPMGG